MNETVICMPAVSSFRNPEQIEREHPDWERIHCPECGSECYETELAREAKREYGWPMLCTNCAISKR